MPNLAELIGLADMKAHELSRLLMRIREEYHSSPSPPGASATSSPSPTGESAGAGSVSGTTGLTLDQVDEVVAKFLEYMRHEIKSALIESLCRMRLKLALSPFVLSASATGGVESQPQASDRRQDNWPGTASDPTSPRERSAPTPMPTRIDWNEALRMADALVSGMWALSVRAQDKEGEQLAQRMEILRAYLLDQSRR